MNRATPFLALIAIGAAWGATQPLGKIAVSSGHAPLGLLFWQSLIGALILGLATLLRGRGLSCAPRHLVLYGVIALIGSILPGITSYSAARHLPSGVLSILLSSVPMWAFPIALALGNDAFRLGRLVGLGFGLAGVALIVLPAEGLPSAVPAVWVGIALISSLCYAFEGNIVQRWGTFGLDPVQTLAGASIVGALSSLPLALVRGEFIDPRAVFDVPGQALVASALLHAGAYSGYVWLVGVAGSVFAVQVSYFVTLFGVTWAMLFLGEGYSGWIWGALVLMLGGLALVQPRPKALVPPAPLSQNAAG